jgi:hypothetical protein
MELTFSRIKRYTHPKLALKSLTANPATRSLPVLATNEDALLISEHETQISKYRKRSSHV